MEECLRDPCIKRSPGASHCTSTKLSDLAGIFANRAILILVDGVEFLPLSPSVSPMAGGFAAWRIATDVPSFSKTRFSFGCILFT